MTINKNKKPHVLCIPFPSQGHITPMLKFAKLLHSRDYHITFINTEYNHKRLLKSRPSSSSSLDLFEDFVFEAIPDSLPPSDEDVTQDIPLLCESLSTKCLFYFREMVTTRLSSPVTFIVSNVFMGFTSDVAAELGIPLVLFWSASACGLMAYLHYKHLIQANLVPLTDESDLETKVEWIPGMENMRLKDMPTFIRTKDINDIVLNYILKDMERVPKASALIINTMHELEQQVLTAMSSITTLPTYAVGPLSLLSKQLLPTLGSNLWKEDMSCMGWLAGKKASSVVYVNFGSVAVMSKKQMVEFAWGLANSEHEFLWVIRPDLVRGDSTTVLPQEFLTKTQGKRLLTSWCPQEEVLKHEAIGGFLTHGGWNSILESISGGVPMLCWPFFAEQQTNCRHMSCEWGIGMEIDEDVEREEVERLIRELMGGEKGKEMKNKVVELKEIALRGCEVGGLSFVHMERVLTDVFGLRGACLN
ncbi:putative 7-deoxyloganetin glucosyltransferase [Dioscorea sansibarensis]